MTMDAPGIRTDTQTFSGAAGTPPAGGLAPADRTSTVTGGAGAGAGGPVPAGDEKPDWAVGDVIDAKYEVTEVIGRGGMGLVYKVHHREWDIDLAVKMPLPHVVADEVAKTRFVREAQTWVDLGAHPNIVQCWYVRELGGVPRLFMDYLPGGSLKQWIREGKILPGTWDAILDLMIQACDGLGYAHSRGVVHRDVQPANMLMSGDGRLCLTDFGLVKVGDAPDEEVEETDGAEGQALVDSGLTVTGSTMGTPQYGAPEQWGEARHADSRADVYALGVVLFELACGRRPFDDGTHSEPPHVLIARHLASPAPDPRTFNPDIPATLAQLILSCLAKDPDRRPQSMASLREILAQLFGRMVGRPYVRPVPEVQRARADALNNRGVSCYDLGKREEARAAWREALQLDACHAEAAYNHSLLDWREGRVDDREALRPLREALRTHPQAGFYLGLLHLERMAADEAEQALSEALERAEPAWSGSARRALGDALMAQENFSDAYAAYTKALLLLPGDTAAQTGQALAVKRTRRRNEEAFFPWRRAAGTLETGPVNALAAGPGGRLLVAAGDGGAEALVLWDFAARRPLLPLAGHAGAVLAAAVSADGGRGLTGGADGTARVWDLAAGGCLRVLEGHTGPVHAAALAPGGRLAVTGGADRTVRVWDADTGTCLRILEGHADAVLAAALSPDGHRAVTAGADRSVRVWDIAAGACLRVLEGHADWATAVGLTFNGAHALSAGADRVLRLWDLADGTPLRIFTGHTDAVKAVAVAPGGRFAVSGGADGTARVWDLATRQCQRTFEGHAGAVKAAAVTPDGRFAVTGGADGTARLWDLGEGSPLSATAFMVCRVGTPVLAQVTGRRFRKSLAASQAALTAGDCRAAYAHLTMARLVKGYERDPEALALNARLSTHLPRTGLRASWFFRTLTGHGDGVNAVAVLPDGRAAVTGSFDDTLRVWEIPSGRALRTIEDAGWVLALAAVPDGRRVVSRSETRLHVWDLESETCLRSHIVGEQAGKGLAVTPDGRFLLSWGESRTGRRALGRWDLATGKASRSSDPAVCGTVEGLAVTPDGRLGVAGGDTRLLHVWDLARSRCLRELKGHRKGVSSVAAAPDGRLAVSGSADRTLRLWDLETGRCLRVCEGHEGAVTSVAVTPDGNFALSGSADRTLRIWDLATGACLKAFEGHAEEINAVAVTPDGRFALSASDDRTLRLWELDWELDPDMTSKSLAETYGIF
jgi:WD40 repeat protein/serine/threonine protein kinase/Flp pilus assembly protein TadD